MHNCDGLIRATQRDIHGAGDPPVATCRDHFAAVRIPLSAT